MTSPKSSFKRGEKRTLLFHKPKSDPGFDPNMEYTTTPKEDKAYRRFMWEHENKFLKKKLRKHARSGRMPISLG